MPKRAAALLSVVALASALMLAGCASEPTRLALGSTRVEAIAQLGQPSAMYALGNGERRQYSRAPAGYEVNNVDLDAAGRVRSVRQELDERWFDATIQPGVWREADVVRTYGRPFELRQVASYAGVVWTWRYRAVNDVRLLHIYIDPAGLVQRYHTGDELNLERQPL